MMVAGRKVLLRVYLWALLVEKQDNVLPFLILLFSIASYTFSLYTSMNFLFSFTVFWKSML